jgi:hypothetical protein
MRTIQYMFVPGVDEMFYVKIGQGEEKGDMACSHIAGA